MAEFAQAISLLMVLEARIWSSVSTDLGGETYAGISRVYWGHHPVWEKIDAAKKRVSDRIGHKAGPSDWKEITKELDKDEVLQRMVDDFYNEWWKAMYLADIKSQRVAFFIFQAAVNFGTEKVSKWAQAACLTNGKQVVMDGVLGPKTIAAINSIPEQDYLFDLVTLQRHGYLMSILNDPTQIANKRGWERRIQKSL